MAHKLYHEAMGSDVRSIISVFTINGNGVFEGLKTLVDDTGNVAKTISNAFPELKYALFSTCLMWSKAWKGAAT